MIVSVYGGFERPNSIQWSLESRASRIRCVGVGCAYVKMDALRKTDSEALLTDKVALSISMFEASNIRYSRLVLLEFIRCCDLVNVSCVIKSVVIAYPVAVH